MQKRMNLPQLAYGFKSGTVKIDHFSKKAQQKIKAFADSVPPDDLKAMAIPPKPYHREVGPIHTRVRQVKTA